MEVKFDTLEHFIPFTFDPMDTAVTTTSVAGMLSRNSYQIAPYVPPTAEELRERMFPVTPRQLRLTLVKNGFTQAQVVEALEGIQDPQARELALIEWEYATMFNRTDDLVEMVGAGLGLTSEQVDTMWDEALAT